MFPGDDLKVSTSRMFENSTGGGDTFRNASFLSLGHAEWEQETGYTQEHYASSITIP